MSYPLRPEKCICQWWLLLIFVFWHCFCYKNVVSVWNISWSDFTLNIWENLSCIRLIICMISVEYLLFILINQSSQHICIFLIFKIVSAISISCLTCSVVLLKQLQWTVGGYVCSLSLNYCNWNETRWWIAINCSLFVRWTNR